MISFCLAEYLKTLFDFYVLIGNFKIEQQTVTHLTSQLHAVLANRCLVTRHLLWFCMKSTQSAKENRRQNGCPFNETVLYEHLNFNIRETCERGKRWFVFVYLFVVVLSKILTKEILVENTGKRFLVS